MPSVYLDNSMTTRPSEKAVSGMIPYLTDRWGSPSAPHHRGQSLFPILKESYEAIYSLLGAKEADAVILTSSGAEAVNQVFMSGYLDHTLTSGRNHFVASTIDEAPALMALNRLEDLGCVGTVVPVNSEGIVTVEALGDVITPRTALVSLSWANGLTGVIQPVAEISALCKERGILLHLDATHILGKLFFDLDEISADFITFNGDHLHAPQGTGGLYIRAGIPCSPLLVGGMEQAGYRSGPLNVPGLVAMGIASKEALESRDYVCMEVARLRDKLEHEVLRLCPEAVVFFRDRERVPHITAIGVPGVSNEALLFLLSKKEVFASIGGGSFQQIGLILAASGIEELTAGTAVSFSLSRETTEDDIDRTVEVFVESIKKLKSISEHISRTIGD